MAVPVFEGVHERCERVARLRQPGVGRGVHQDLVLGHRGAEQRHHVFDA